MRPVLTFVYVLCAVLFVPDLAPVMRMVDKATSKGGRMASKVAIAGRISDALRQAGCIVLGQVTKADEMESISCRDGEQ